ncbi:DNA polymerase III subunit gamma/tau [Candidatus Falkowbacteria bacterium]|jgi:DNA polymerase-3 subunit gamma/tau|nr:DNA polymerase III subunit gamma/tau [Candidatus Falkowbacteria bacterium]
MSTLYRDYRPQSFSEVLGQNHIKITLQNEIKAGKLAQAFLFCGPRAVGKTTLARVLAKTVNCENRKEGESEPCNKCASCLSITQGKNLDVVEIDAASNTGVDNVRENIISFSRLTPTNSKFKVFIIDEVHMLSISAFNALLKIIEEPPAYVIFILCTTEIQKVPATIISRCERFDFKRISVSDIVKKLSLIAAKENIEIDTEVLEAVARRSGGHLRDAESLLGQIFALGGKKISLEDAELIIPHYNSHEAVDLLDYLSKKDAAKAIALINKLADSGVNLKNFTGELIALLRKMILNKVNASLTDNLGLNMGESLEIKISSILSNISWEQLLFFTKRFLEAYNDSKNSLISQLPLELAIVELCYSANQAPPLSLSSPVVNNNSVGAANKNTAAAIKPIKKEEAGVKKNSDQVINLNQAEVLEKWPEFLIKIKKYNHSLSFVLQNCQPQEIKNNQLSLIFKYKFHHDRINDSSIKLIVETTLVEVFGVALSLNLIIDENLEINQTEEKEEVQVATAEAVEISEGPTTQKEGSSLSNLLKTFGGEVIN